MKKILLFIAILVTSLGATAEELMSPNRQFVLNTYCKDGIPYYTLSYKGRVVIHQSRLGMDIKNEGGMKDNMELQSVERQSKDETWNTVWGEQSAVRNNYNEMLAHVSSMCVSACSTTDWVFVTSFPSSKRCVSLC